MKLYRIGLVEERVVATGELDALLTALPGLTDHEFEGYVRIEELLTPEATLHFTQDDLLLLVGAVSSSILAYEQKIERVDPNLHQPEWYDRRDALRRLKTKLDGAVWQLAAQRTLLEKGVTP